jgi:two-component system, NarL family, response regulator NreC
VSENHREGSENGVIRVLIADDHALVRSGMRMLLEDEPGFEVVGEAADGAQALELARALRPSVLLADVSMPPPDGIELTQLLSREAPHIRTIVVTMHENDAVLREAVAAGAWGYVVKRSGPLELIDAIRAVTGGRKHLDRLLRERGARWEET